ncbi:hypothetical protein RDI58_026634 [Solanum bulbocastanum]|uniref:Uncharacterized protein n=1 Tax=Solanum bulbocastanum TaxID=147425 RepID=A0AAN8Y3I1_SOLBU
MPFPLTRAHCRPKKQTTGAMVLHCYFSGTTLHSLKLASIPHFSRTLTFRLTPYYNRPLLRFVVRSLSASAIQTSVTAATTEKYQVVKPQWKAAIDFKWIRDNESVAVNIKNRMLIWRLFLSSTRSCSMFRRSIFYPTCLLFWQYSLNLLGHDISLKILYEEYEHFSYVSLLFSYGKNLKKELVTLEEELLKLTDELQQEAQSIPNMTYPDVPLGGEDSSTVRKMVGKPAEFSFTIKDHVQLGKELDLFDFDAAAEVNGSKFYYLKNEAVILELGLVNWAVSEAMKRGFTPLTTPEIVRSSVVEKCGFQPCGTNTQVCLSRMLMSFG